MHHLHAITRFAQPLAHVFRNHHRTMLPAGATETDRQIALSFPDIVR